MKKWFKKQEKTAEKKKTESVQNEKKKPAFYYKILIKLYQFLGLVLKVLILYVIVLMTVTGIVPLMSSYLYGLAVQGISAENISWAYLISSWGFPTLFAILLLFIGVLYVIRRLLRFVSRFIEKMIRPCREALQENK